MNHELDALIAAPQHHKLLFENEMVRLLDASIPAREKTNLHEYRYSALLYFIIWSDFIRYDADRNVMLDSPSLEKIPLPGTGIGSDPLAAHALKNVGENSLPAICVEIKTKR